MLTLKKLFYCIAFLLLIALKTYAQFGFNKTDSVQIYQNNIALKLPWAGGFNYMQFSEIDLNYDGIKDLFAFDKSSNKVITFLNEGTENTVSYKYAPQYIKKFPTTMRDWVLLADYNCDGKEDVFTQNQGAIKIHRNTGNAISGLQFETAVEKLYSIYYFDSIPLYVSSVDIPSISDIDSDGDLDIVTYSVNGYYVEYHQNLSKETYGNCDSLKFSLATSCWADFKEDQSNCSIYLNLPCGNMVHENNSEEDRNTNHSGSALLAINLDGDADKDLLVSDISCSTITGITNGGNIAHAFGTQQDNTFPNYDTPINISIFPTPFYLDVNNDGIKDLLASPNTSVGSENRLSSWYYKNTGTTDNPNFKYQQNDFLVGEMIDNGEGAYPAFFDYNSDGLLDFVVGNIGRFVNSEIKARLMLYKNIGTANYPKYSLEDDDYLGLSTTTNLNYIVPAFGDLDADGDVDLLLGAIDGKLTYYLNIAASGTIANFQLVQTYFSNIDVGNNAAPQLVDVNRDGKLDLIVGNYVGKIRYYQNNGTSQSPIFDEITTFFGDVFTGIDNGVTLNDGYCIPQLFDVAGTYHLLCGSKSGRIFRYGNIDGNLSGTFTKIDTNYAQIWEGRNSAIAIADINNDGQKDMIIGNVCGGLNYYSGDITAGTKENDFTDNNVKLFPNPVMNFVTISSAKIIETIIVYNCLGQIVMSVTNIDSNSKKLNVEQLNDGVYLCKVISEAKSQFEKIIITK